MIKINRETLANLYLDWINNYLTVEKFAEHHGLTESEALTLINLAKLCHENKHPDE